jgi:hypothetical protein
VLFLLSPMCSSCPTCLLWSTQYLMRTTNSDAHYAIFFCPVRSILLLRYPVLKHLQWETVSHRQNSVLCITF